VICHRYTTGTAFLVGTFLCSLSNPNGLRGQLSLPSQACFWVFQQLITYPRSISKYRMHGALLHIHSTRLVLTCRGNTFYCPALVFVCLLGILVCMQLAEAKITHCLCGLLYTQVPPINFLVKIRTGWLKKMDSIEQSTAPQHTPDSWLRYSKFSARSTDWLAWATLKTLFNSSHVLFWYTW